MDRNKDKKSKKHKKEKKHKKSKKRDYRSSSSSSEEPIRKKSKRRQKHSSSESENSGSEWVEKGSSSPKSKPVRDEWLSLSSTLTTTNNESRRKQRELAKKEERDKQIYNPSCSARELNPYWKDGGDGLPKFQKPNSDDEDNDKNGKRSKHNRSGSSSNWRKKTAETSVVKENDESKNETKSDDDDDETPKKLSDAEMNALAAKIIKAEIMGDDDLVKELKAKLERARGAQNDDAEDDSEVVLTRTDSKGFTKPVRNLSDGGEGSSKGKKKKIETHSGGERVRYYADDDKYSLKEMFENEKFNSAEDQNADFLKMSGKVRNEEDLDDIFTDKIRKKEPKGKSDKRNKDKAIGEHQRMANTLDKCNKCFQSETMLKHLMLSMGETFYLSLPSHEPLTEGHCLLIPIRHAVCGTQLDENEWSELMDFRKSLTRMFQSKEEDVIFFETANYLNRYPHMVIECVPMPKETGDLAPIYFKKAIDESETEWASNKKLISLTGKNVQRAVPKGLPYFSVSFGMDEGYAHVIEDQQMFPNNFAQEIIGGMLDLHHSKWRKPKSQTFDEQSKRVLDFSIRWNEFNFT